MTAPAHTVKDKEGNEVEVPEQFVTKDDGPRAGTTAEKLAALPAGVQAGRHASRPATPARSTTAPRRC